MQVIEERYPRVLDSDKTVKDIWNLADKLIEGRNLLAHQFDHLPLTLGEFRGIIEEVETKSVQKAKANLAELCREHKSLTLAWAKASELQAAVLKEEADRLEGQIALWQELTVPLWGAVGAGGQGDGGTAGRDEAGAGGSSRGWRPCRSRKPCAGSSTG